MPFLTVLCSHYCQGGTQQGSLVSLMIQRTEPGDDGSGGGGGGGGVPVNGEQQPALPGASAASAFQAVQPVQQRELLRNVLVVHQHGQ